MHDHMSTQQRVANQAVTGGKAGRPMRSMDSDLPASVLLFILARERLQLPF
jgi:hypothetical protein